MAYQKILIILLIILVSIEVTWLCWRVPKLSSLQGQPETQRGIVKEELATKGRVVTEEEIGEGAKLWLEPSEGEFSGQFTVDIFVQTLKPIDGLDVRLLYPKDQLSILDQDKEKGGIQVEVGKFDEYPINKVDEGQGLILLSGIVLGKAEEIVPLNQPFLVGRVTFNIVAPGEANLSFDFQPGLTTDSNVAEKGTAKDILKEVQGATFKITK